MTAWTPQIQVFDESHIRDLLTAYVQANQTEALIWANNQRGQGLPGFTNFFRSPRLVTKFPSWTFISSDHTAKWNEILTVDYSLLIECALIHGDRDEAARQAVVYAAAVESMLVNVPETTFSAESKIPITSTGMAVETKHAVQGQYKNGFIEIFQTTVKWEIEASAFET